MSEIRMGHDQIVLHVDSVRFKDGELVIRASGYPPKDKSAKLTGDQPFVLIGDDGKKVVATWHHDLTEICCHVRENPGGFMDLEQKVRIDYIHTI